MDSVDILGASSLVKWYEEPPNREKPEYIGRHKPRRHPSSDVVYDLWQYVHSLQKDNSQLEGEYEHHRDINYDEEI